MTYDALVPSRRVEKLKWARSPRPSCFEADCLIALRTLPLQGDTLVAEKLGSFFNVRHCGNLREWLPLARSRAWLPATAFFRRHRVSPPSKAPSRCSRATPPMIFFMVARPLLSVRSQTILDAGLVMPGNIRVAFR